MKFDKQELEKKIRDAKDLSNEDKSNLLGLLNEKKTYGLVWEDSTEDAWEKMKDYIPVLKEDETKQILHGSDNPNHILIEGDNLYALTALSYTYEGKVDVIYIDPPYNTGKNDFVYNDKFIGEDDSYRHSMWLSFMEKRLKIAKRLLSDKGVLFISIDDNEQSNLKLLCDSIFGEENAIGPFIQNKMNSKNDTINVQKNHEFVLCYRRKTRFYDNHSTNIIPNIIVNSTKTKEVFKEGNDYYYLNDPITTRGEGGTLNARPNLGYSFYYNPITKNLIPVADYSIELAKTENDENIVYSSNVELLQKGYLAIRPPKVRGKLGCWTWDINKSRSNIKLLIAKGSRNRYNIVKRTFVPQCNVFENEGHFFYKEEVVSNSRSIIDYSTNEGTNTFKEIMGNEVVFNNPKNIDMIIYFISISSVKNSTILDFFAGSGTTLHATMKLNAEDGGHRKCILVTNNENNICEEVTYERNKRVIEGYTKPNGEFVEGLKDNNLRYYKIDFKERKQSHQSNRELFHEMKDLLCIKEDIYQEQHQFGSLPLKGKERMIRYFAENGRELLMVYDTRVIPFIVKEIEKMSEKEQPLKIYIFADGAYPYTDDFATVIDKVSLVPMPYAYYRGIKDSLPDVEPKKDDNTELTDEEQKQMMAEAIEAENNEKKED